MDGGADFTSANQLKGPAMTRPSHEPQLTWEMLRLESGDVIARFSTTEEAAAALATYVQAHPWAIGEVGIVASDNCESADRQTDTDESWIADLEDQETHDTARREELLSISLRLHLGMCPNLASEGEFCGLCQETISLFGFEVTHKDKNGAVVHESPEHRNP